MVAARSFQRGKQEAFPVSWYEEPEQDVCLSVAISGLSDDSDETFFEDILTEIELFKTGDRIEAFNPWKENFIAAFSNAFGKITRKLSFNHSICVLFLLML